MQFIRTMTASLCFTFTALALGLVGCESVPVDGEQEDDTDEPEVGPSAYKCPFAIKCAPGYHAVDTDGDGCNDTCELTCTTAIKCAPGYHAVDTDGDGCNDTCELTCTTAIKCAPGYHAVDTDGDGCNDTCEPN